MTCPSCGREVRSVARDAYCHDCGGRFSELAKPPAEPDAPLPFDREDTRSEKAIQAAVRLRWEFHGYHVWDMSQSRPTQQTPGIPDLICLSTDGTGIVLCEVKAAKGRQSQYQREVQAQAEAAGIPYIITRHEDAVDEFMKRRAA